MSEQYAFDMLKMHPVTSISVSPFQKSVLLASYHSLPTQVLPPVFGDL